MKNLLLLCFIIPHIGFAQQVVKGIVMDSNSKDVISYAGVLLQDHKTITWKDGSFFIELEKIGREDTLYVQCLGYETYKAPLANYLASDVKEILLTPKHYSIGEVTVSTQKVKRKKNKTFGIYKKKTKGWYKTTFKRQFALYIPNQKSYDGIIQNVRFYITNDGTPDKKFRIHLYAVDSLTNDPGKDLLPEAIYTSGTIGEEWVVVDLIKYQINFPPTGFFIAVEALPNSIADTYVTIRKKKYKTSQQNVVLGLSHEKPRDNLTWYWREPYDKWRRGRKLDKNEVNGHPMMASDILIFKY
ncbi:hypothetical protein ACXR6G_16485 [Ancylomarina sp. YFZ004]